MTGEFLRIQSFKILTKKKINFISRARDFSLPKLDRGCTKVFQFHLKINFMPHLHFHYLWSLSDNPSCWEGDDHSPTSVYLCLQLGTQPWICSASASRQTDLIIAF